MKPSPPLPREDLEAVFAQVGNDWERARGKNVFLTGGSGFFGSWLLETLLFAEDQLKLGVKIWALSRDPGRFRMRLPHLAGHKAVNLLGGGVESFALPKGKMDFAIHSMVPDPGMPLPEMEEWFRRGTGRLLELAVRNKSEGFLLCSTGAVYLPQNRPLSEEDPLIPLDAPLSYGRIRRQVEDQCLESCKANGIPLKIARGFTFAGPRLPENAGFALVDFLKDAAAGRNIRVKGTGEPVRSYLYAADMAVWLWKILLDRPNSGAFNVGSEKGIRLADLAGIISAKTGVETEILGGADAGVASNGFYVPCPERAKEQFGMLPSRPLECLVQSSLVKARCMFK